MRILFRGTVHPTSLSKSLRKALAGHGHAVGIRTCENLVAAMTGYATWHELATVCGTLPEPSPRDDEVPPAVAAARRGQYAAALVPLCGPAVAGLVVDALRPTGARAAPVPPSHALLPFTNAAYAARLAADPACGLVARRVEKAPGGAAVTRADASALCGLLDMDPTVCALTPTPLALSLSERGRTATFVPDFAVRCGVLASDWYVHVADGAMAGPDRWIADAAVRAMSELGMPLLVVDPAALGSDRALGAGSIAGRCRGIDLDPGMAVDIVRIVRAAPEGGISVADLAATLRDLGWHTRDKAIARGLRDRSADRGAAYLRMATARILRAVRESYVDIDPASAGEPGATVRPAHAFLSERTVLGLLLPSALASTDPAFLSEIGRRSEETVRRLPEGIRFEAGAFKGTPTMAGTYALPLQAGALPLAVTDRERPAVRGTP